MARAADLIGEDPRVERPPRPALSEASQSIGPGEVAAARDDQGRDMAVYATRAGAVFAVLDQCPHDGGPLSSGFVEDGKLVCARHGWEFDGENGNCPGRSARICPRRVAQVRES